MVTEKSQRKQASIPFDTALHKLRKFIRHLNSTLDSGESSFTTAPEIIFSDRDLGGLLLWDKNASQYRACLKEFFAIVDERADVGHRTIEHAIQQAILRSLDITEQKTAVDFDARTTTALDALRSVVYAPTRQWNVHVSVLGLDKKQLPVTFGGVEFYHLDDARAEAMKQDLQSILSAKNYTGDALARAQGIFDRTVDSQLSGKCFAHVIVSASDPDAAMLRASDKVGEVIDAINFFVGVLFHRLSMVNLPVEGAVVHSVGALFTHGESPDFRLPVSQTGRFIPLPLRELASDRANKMGAQRVSEILQTTMRTDLESRILSAIRWAGRASVKNRLDEALLLFVIALETILLGATRTVEYKLRVRLAHLLGTSLESKRKLAAGLRSLYDVRSNVVHSGNSSITGKQVSQAAWFAKASIVEVLTSAELANVRTAAELDTWFEDKTLQ